MMPRPPRVSTELLLLMGANRDTKLCEVEPVGGWGVWGQRRVGTVRNRAQPLACRLKCGSKAVPVCLERCGEVWRTAVRYQRHRKDSRLLDIEQSFLTLWSPGGPGAPWATSECAWVCRVGDGRRWPGGAELSSRPPVHGVPERRPTHRQRRVCA